MITAGNSHYTAATDEEALDWVQDLISFLPSNNRSFAPEEDFDAEEGGIEDNLTPDDLKLDDIIPDSATVPYDVREVIQCITDDGEYLEIQADRAENIVIAFGRIEGQSVGFVANQPTQFAGCLDIDSSEKAARFVRTCDAFNIPIVMLVDVPGFLPGAGQEYGGILRRGAKLLYAYGEATVPKITVTMRKAYGGAYAVMGSKNLSGDLNFAWPTAQIAVMGSAAAVVLIQGKQLEAAPPEQRGYMKKLFMDFYDENMTSPYVAAERGYIDAMIEPAETRLVLRKALRQLENKSVVDLEKKHTIMPM